MSKQYVQHMSGQGEKWHVLVENAHDWIVETPPGSLSNYHLPKSEYGLCEPLGRWVDVTKDTRRRRSDGFNGSPVVDHGMFITHEFTDIAKLICGSNYRAVKVRIGLFPAGTEAWIIEKLEEP